MGYTGTLVAGELLVKDFSSIRQHYYTLIIVTVNTIFNLYYIIFTDSYLSNLYLYWSLTGE
jgi:hypothetical protein